MFLPQKLAVCSGFTMRVIMLKLCRGNVGELITNRDQRGVKDYLLQNLDLEQVLTICTSYKTLSAFVPF